MEKIQMEELSVIPITDALPLGQGEGEGIQSGSSKLENESSPLEFEHCEGSQDSEKSIPEEKEKFAENEVETKQSGLRNSFSKLFRLVQPSGSKSKPKDSIADEKKEEVEQNSEQPKGAGFKKGGTLSKVIRNGINFNTKTFEIENEMVIGTSGSKFGGVPEKGGAGLGESLCLEANPLDDVLIPSDIKNSFYQQRNNNIQQDSRRKSLSRLLNHSWNNMREFSTSSHKFDPFGHKSSADDSESSSSNSLGKSFRHTLGSYGNHLLPHKLISKDPTKKPKESSLGLKFLKGMRLKKKNETTK